MMNIDQFKPTLVYTIYIKTTPEKVWQALTSGELSGKYFFGNAVEIDQRIGGAFIVRAPDGSLHISGEVVECERPKKLTVTFNVNWPALIELHDRPLSDDILSGGRSGWPAILSSLKSLLETGEPLVVKLAPPQRMLEALKALGIGTP